MNETNLEVGRVLRASTTGFAVGCRVSQLSEPGFGALVKAQPLGQQEAIYGLIYNIHIDDDPLIRRLVMTESPQPAVIEDQRNNRLLPIEMSVLTIGYTLGQSIYHGLPPRPPLNLDPVFLCRDTAELRKFTDRPGYLPLILRAEGSQVPVDQLLIAHIRRIYDGRGEDSLWVKQFVEELVAALRNNYDLLVPALEAISRDMPAIDAGPEFDILSGR